MLHVGAVHTHGGSYFPAHYACSECGYAITPADVCCDGLICPHCGTEIERATCDGRCGTCAVAEDEITRRRAHYWKG